MDIVVCVKRVPLTQEVDLEIDASGITVRQDDLAHTINEWDSYAIEEAVLLKEQQGGTVTAITVGSEDDEEVLTRCLAMGADSAIRVDAGERTMDSFVISRIMAEVIKDLPHDLVFTGVQAEDDGQGLVGIMLAEHLELAHAAVVTDIELDGGEATIRVELSAGMKAVLKIQLPALLSIQTGINEPRYVSIMGIRKAAKKEIRVVPLDQLALSEDDLTARTIVQEVYHPPEVEGAEILEGDSARIADEILRIVREKGVSV
jgi:electron transfer flavoprotein beta subunit